jgi:hypothetical protein
VYTILGRPISSILHKFFRELKVKEKIVKLSLCFFLTEHHAIEEYCGSEGTAPLIL